jgi:hypothetical protein
MSETLLGTEGVELLTLEEVRRLGRGGSLFQAVPVL